MHSFTFLAVAALVVSSAAYHCRWHYTGERFGRGAIGPYDLRNLRPYCRNGEISRFQVLSRYANRGVYLRYKYLCCHHPNIRCYNAQHSTYSQTRGPSPFGAANYLDRHRPYCHGSRRALQSFGLINEGAQVRYAYTCCTHVKPLRYCYNQITPSSVGSPRVNYLDRQLVSCRGGDVLKRFQLIVRYGSPWHFQYSYICCKPR